MHTTASLVPGFTPEAALVVDGDPDYLKAIRAALTDDVAHIEAVTSIAAAVTQLQTRGHRLVIMDAALPGDPAAVDLVRALRRTRPEVAIVMTSAAQFTSTQIAACFEAGADEFIQKPFHPQEFSARVGAVTRRVRRSMSVTTAATNATEYSLQATA